MVVQTSRLITVTYDPAPKVVFYAPWYGGIWKTFVRSASFRSSFLLFG